ncbi:MAG: zinc ribbon domain-containing protein [Ruminococcaceae bacterium]|nr:zinc ribbon domain-containing protein [Oscillospiraceae bacterium]
MFCKNCGKEIVDNATFCGYCGTQVTTSAPAESTATVESEVVPAPVAPVAPAIPVAADTPVAPVENPQFAQADFGTPAATPKKKNFKPLIIASIAVVLVAAIVLTVVLITKKSNKKNNSDVEASVGNMVSVLSQNTSLDKKVDAVMDGYNAIASKLSTGTNMQFKINLSDETVELLNSLASSEGGTNVDFGALNETTVNLNAHSKDNLFLVEAALASGGQNLIDVNVIFDVTTTTLYMGSPSLSETYLTLSLDDMLDEMDIDSDMLASNSQMMNMYMSLFTGEFDTSFLPTEAEINTIVNTYADTVIPYLVNDSEVPTTITVDGISQQVTECTMDISTKDVQDILVAVLETLKNDSTVKNIIERTISFLTESGLVDADELGGFSMDQFGTAIDMAISNFKSTPASDEVIMTFVRYVDSNNMIIGRELIIENETILYHATATEGSNYASTFELEDDFRIEGKGTIANGKKTGTLNLTSGYKTITFNIKDFSIDSNGINGSIIYYLEEDMLEDMLDMDNDFVSMLTNGAKPGVELKFSSTESSGGLELNIVAGDKAMFGMAISAESVNKTDIAVPQNAISYKNAEQWAETIDEEAFMKRIENSPLGFLVTAMTQVNRVESDAVARR